MSMSTRAFIGIRNLDGSVTGIYSHWDGYPEYLGDMLLNHYTDWRKVIELINLGDVSIVKERATPTIGRTHSFNAPSGDVTVAYHRDRGEDWGDIAPRTYEDVLDVVKHSWYDYIYVWEREQSWYVGDVVAIPGYIRACERNNGLRLLSTVRKYAKLTACITSGNDEEWKK